jgi:hypothetical protein
MCPCTRDGTVLMAYRGSNPARVEHLGMAAGPGLFGPYQRLSLDPIIPGSAEDPYLWTDPNGHLHILFHSFNVGAVVALPAGRHAPLPCTPSLVPRVCVCVSVCAVPFFVRWRSGVHQAV